MTNAMHGRVSRRGESLYAAWILLLAGVSSFPVRADWTPPTRFSVSGYFGSSGEPARSFTSAEQGCDFYAKKYNAYASTNGWADRLTGLKRVVYSYTGGGEAPVKNEGNATCVFTRAFNDNTPADVLEHEAVQFGVSCGPQSPGDSSAFWVASGYRANYRGSSKTCGCAPDLVEKGNQCLPPEEAPRATSDDKNAGGGDTCALVGNPVNPLTGAKFLTETDYVGGNGLLRLEFTRSYNAPRVGSAERFAGGVRSPDRPGAMGRGWRHNYERGLEFDHTNAATGSLGAGSVVRVVRSDGSAVSFTRNAAGLYQAEPDVADTLVADGASFVYRDASTDTNETYDAAGRLLKLTARGGWVQSFEYSTGTTPVDIAPRPGMLIKVMDASGRALELRYDSVGRVVAVRDPSAQEIRYTYDELSNLVTVTYQDEATRQYRYNEAEFLQALAHDETGEQIDADLPHALTGIIDEAGTRYATYRYRADGRATETARAGGADRFSFAYDDANLSTTVTDPLNTARTIKYEVKHGVRREISKDKVCAVGVTGAAGYKQQTYDGNGRLKSVIDFDSYRRDYIINARGLEDRRVEGLNSNGTARAETRTVSTEWHGTWRAPVKRAEPLLLTTWRYDTAGNAVEMAAQATKDPSGSAVFQPQIDTGVPVRKWAFTYDGMGRMLTVDGPRTDVADKDVYIYYSSSDSATPKRYWKGDLKSATNAAGHAITYQAYDAHGNVLSQIDANGLVTTFRYDERGRLLERVVGDLSEEFAWDSRGLLIKHKTIDGLVWRYGYDDAHRPITVADAAGSKINRTLNGYGQPLREYVTSPTGVLQEERTNTYNAQAFREKTSSPSGAYTSFSYDGRGNVLKTQDKLGRVHQRAYDALGRLTKELAPPLTVGGASAETNYGWNAQGKLIKVTDPLRLVTTYVRNGFGLVTSLISPDSGTESREYDAAGNLTKKITPVGTTTYTYDSLNRLTGLKEAGANVTSSLGWAYDDPAVPYSKGRLSAALLPGNAVTFAYDQHGRVVQKSGIDGYTTQYGTPGSADAGRMVSYSLLRANRRVGYRYDVNGNIAAVTTVDPAPGGEAPIGAERQVVSGAAHQLRLDGSYSLTTYKFGDGVTAPKQTWVRPRDLAGRASSYTSAGQVHGLRYDDADRIKEIYLAAAPATRVAYGYDNLDRLVSAAAPQISHTYAYDLNGNRSRRASGTSVWTTTFNVGSNRLSSVLASDGLTKGVSHDGAGAVSALVAPTGASITLSAWDLGDARYPSGASAGPVQFVPDASGGRAAKQYGVPPSGSLPPVLMRTFVQSGANLLSEFEIPRTGLLPYSTRDYIWLGSTPVAVIAGADPTKRMWVPQSGATGTTPANPPAIYYVHADHLDTPRAITDTAGRLRWQWSPLIHSEPFGADGPSQQPTAGLPAFEFNLRFAGQYYDRETGLHYNGARMYNPEWGRYTAVDPLGLAEGTNLYSYVSGNPLSFIDPLGLAKCDSNGGGTTEPTLPPKQIAEGNGVKVEHYYRSDDHAPAHAHVVGGGRTTRIGANGKPLAGDPELTSVQRAVVDENRSAVRKSVNKIGRWLDYKEGQ